MLLPILVDESRYVESLREKHQGVVCKELATRKKVQ